MGIRLSQEFIGLVFLLLFVHRLAGTLLLWGKPQKMNSFLLKISSSVEQHQLAAAFCCAVGLAFMQLQHKSASLETIVEHLQTHKD